MLTDPPVQKHLGDQSLIVLLLNVTGCLTRTVVLFLPSVAQD